MKLRNKLMISYLTASIIPIILISSTIYYLSAKSIEESSQEFASLYISQATTNLDNFLDQHNKSTQSILLERDIMQILGKGQPNSMDKIIENKDTIQRFFVRTASMYSEIKTIMLVDIKGDVYHYSRNPNLVNVEVLRQQQWYENILKSEKSMFLTPVHNKSYYSNDKEGAMFTVGRILQNYNGSYAGLILFDMDPSQLIQLSDDFLTIDNRYDIQLVITDDNGGLIYHSDAATGQQAWTNLFDKLYFPKEAEMINDRIVLSKETSEGGFQLSAEIPLNNLLARINNIKDVTFWSIIAGFLFISFISILFSYRITKPIHDLRRSMKRVESGDYSYPITVSNSNSELGNLVNSYNKMISKIKKLIEDVYLAGMKRKQSQYLALQSQINPHMLYNTLESIRMKAVVNEQDEIAEMIKILSRMFRISLNMDRKHHFVRHEVEYATNFIHLQNIRYDNRFTLEVCLSEKVLNTSIIPLIFQPIVENSIKHGFKEYSQGLHIKIEEEFINAESVLIRIVDNGISLSEERVSTINSTLEEIDIDDFNSEIEKEGETNSGIGLRNIAERLKLQYGDEYYLRIHALPGGGTVVEMMLPISEENP